MYEIMMMQAAFRGQVDPRRKQEKNDARMIREDHSAIANLSNQPVYKEFNAWRDVERLKMY